MKHLLFRLGTNRGQWLRRVDARLGHALDAHIHRESDVAVTQNRLNIFRWCSEPIAQLSDFARGDGDVHSPVGNQRSVRS